MTTAVATPTDVSAYCHQLAVRARDVSRLLAASSGQLRADALRRAADRLLDQSQAIQSANTLDLAEGQKIGLSSAMLDRLKLDTNRIAAMAHSVRQIANQPDPVGQIIEGSVRPNGLRLQKLRVPIGVVLIIYESRPNVTSDAAALCVKSANAVILRGGKEALHSNQAIAQCVREGLSDAGLDPDAVQLVQTTDRSVVGVLLKQVGKIDLAIPRGGESLIRAVVEQSHIPVIKHYAGNCHVYVDAAAEDDMALDICLNAKTQRPGVCNAAETFLFHEAAAQRGLLTKICRALLDRKVEIRGDPTTLKLLGALPGAGVPAGGPAINVKPATDEDWTTEYLDLIVAVGVVKDVDAAIDHINRYGSAHTDAIITDNLTAAQKFVQSVDSANVFVNCSTRFSDGGEYGLGAEIGISTDKLHARGPMGAADLTTYKWVVYGDGQVRT